MCKTATFLHEDMSVTLTTRYDPHLDGKYYRRSAHRFINTEHKTYQEP